jgi:spore maturation protein CgeB
MADAPPANAHPSRSPRVLVIGPIYGGSLETARSTARASEALGAETRLLDFDVFGAGWHALSALPMAAAHKTKLRVDYAKVLGEAVVASAFEFRPDLVIALAQAPIHASVSDRLRTAGIKVAFWFVENHRVLPYWKQVAKDYDAFFAMQDEPFLSMLRDAGAAKAIYLPTAADPERHVPIELTEAERRRFGADLSFAGAPYLNRQRMLLGLIDLAPKIWGEGWAGTEVARLAPERGARFDLFEMIRIFAATKINLNIHSANHVAGLDPDPDYVNPRTFELAACGAFQLVDARAPLATMFREDEMVTFRSMAELRQRITHYLGHPDERAAIAARARARVLAEHTFAHRVRQIFAELLPAELQPRRSAAVRGLAEAIAAHERTSTRLTPDEAMLRVLQHVQGRTL